ncbi:MAG: helix-turn-helix domain-containing protein [Pikeienuella sp.]
MTTENIASNLRYLCGKEKSVSHVCRRLGFNRQQFGRYLNGANRPSVYNLTRICRHFGVSVDEIVMPHAEFRARAAAISAPPGQTMFPAPIAEELRRLSASATANLDSHVGYHFRYQHAFAFPGYVFKTLVSVGKIGGHYCTKHIERIPRNNAPTAAPLIFKHHGLLLGLCGRIFHVEHEASVQGAVSHTVYAPIIRSGRRLMSGVGCSISSSSDNHPTAARSVLEFIGPDADPRKALRRCGLFRPGSGAVDSYVAAMIDNRNRESEFTLQAHRG